SRGQGLALPFGPQLAGVEDEVAGRDHRVPRDRRLGETVVGRVVGDRRPAIVVAVRADRPAVIVARLDLVDLVAAARAVLEIPQVPVRVELQARYVAVAVAPDLARDAAAIGEGIAFGRAAVEVQP